MRFLAVFPVTLLFGCGASDIPSSEDIEKELKVPFGDCKYFYIDNVKKTNGIPQQDGSYLVYATFDVTVEPLEANEELAKTYHQQFAKREELYTQKKKEIELIEQNYSVQFEALEKEFAAKRESPEFDQFEHQTEYNERRSLLSQANSNEKENLEAKYEKIRQENNLPEYLDLSKFEAAQFQNIANECTQLKFKALSYLRSDNRLKMFAEGEKRSFEYEAYMIKTENGWMIRN